MDSETACEFSKFWISYQLLQKFDALLSSLQHTVSPVLTRENNIHGWDFQRKK